MSGSARTGTASIPTILCLAAAFVALGDQARAQTFDRIGKEGDEDTQRYIVARSRLAYTDNVRRVPTDQESDTLASLGFGIDYGYTVPRLDAVALGNLDYVEYLNNSFGSQLTGRFDGQAVWGKNTDFFQWRLEETFGQTRANALAAATPDNLQNVNLLSTGPAFNVGFGSNQLSVDALYTNQQYGGDSLDSDRYTGQVSLARLLSKVGFVSLNVRAERMRFRNSPTDIDYDTREYFVSYHGEAGRTSVTSDLGYTELERDIDHQVSGGALAHLELERRVSPSSSVFMSGRMQFSQAADVVRIGAASGSVNTGAETPLSTSDPFRDREVRLGWRYNQSRTGFTVSATRGSERYEQRGDLDRNVMRFDVQADRHVAPTVWLRLEGRYQKEQFQNVDADAKDLLLASEISMDVGRRLGVTLRYEYNDRAGSGGATTYHENFVSLNFNLLLAGHR